MSANDGLFAPPSVASNGIGVDGDLGPADQDGYGAIGLLHKFNFNSVAAIVSILFAIFLFLIIPHQIETPLIVFGQSLNALDPALFPRIVAAGFLVLGIWYFFKSFKIEETNGLRTLDGDGYVNVGVSLAAFGAYALLMEPLGFVPSSAMLVAGLAVFYGVRDLALVLAVSIGVPTTVFFVFTRGLKVFLPEIPWL